MLFHLQRLPQAQLLFEDSVKMVVDAEERQGSGFALPPTVLFVSDMTLVDLLTAAKIVALHNLVTVLLRRCEFQRAKALCSRAKTLAQATLPQEHPWNKKIVDSELTCDKVC